MATTQFLNLDTDGTLSSNSDTLVPSEKAIKTYVDTNTVSSVTAGSTADKINVTKNGSTSTITVNNVASATKATQDANGNTITTYYLNTSNTAQTKTGDLTLKGNLYAGEAFPFNGDGSTVYRTKNIVNNGRTALYSGFYAMSSQMDRLYGLVYNSTWKCTCNYKGDGTASVSPAQDGLWVADKDTNNTTGTSAYLSYLFNGRFSSGATFPVNNLSTNPVIITISTVNNTYIDATDVNYLMLTGWRYGGGQPSWDHYGKLSHYKVELLVQKDSDNSLEWVKTFEKNGEAEWINNIIIPLWSGSTVTNWADYKPTNTSGYKNFYGVRLTILGAEAGGISGVFGLTSIKIMECRPSSNPSSGVGAFDAMGGTLYGNLTLSTKYEDTSISPETNNKGYLGKSAKRWKAAYAETFYGALSGNASTATKATQDGDGATISSTYIKTSTKGATNGVASLDSNTKIPVAQLPTMTGANGSSAGTAGAVPAPAATDNTKFLRGDGTWATVSSGSVSIDNKSITQNGSSQLQTVGVIDQNNTSTAMKTWTGTKAQYDAITTKDSNTYYHITDDVDATASLLATLYPVGSIYITTNSTCPLSALISGSSWTLVGSGKVLQGADANHAVNTTVEAGLPNITGSIQLQFTQGGNTNGAISCTTTTSQGWGSSSGNNTTDLSFDASDSNSIYGNSNTVQPPAYIVNIFRRTA